ncbi:hypothetical protein ACQKI4_25745 [Paenibacillus glucanolyticus]|uniref:hypothetical protein n=1 Tax=Paenibacillus glucanolyticus TaxID=59843 RepID=UPI003D02C350
MPGQPERQGGEVGQRRCANGQRRGGEQKKSNGKTDQDNKRHAAFTRPCFLLQEEG